MDLEKTFNILFNHFGPQGWWPIVDIEKNKAVYNKNFPYRERNSSEKLEISIGAILTQNTNWTNVVKAIMNLKNNDCFTIHKLKKIHIDDLAILIKPSGYYIQKAKKIKIFIESDINISRNNLLSLWGIGEETADSILLYGYNLPFFIIDNYTKRIINRLFSIQLSKYSQYQSLITSLIKNKYYIYNEFHALFVILGKTVCSKNKPKCHLCPLSLFCKYKELTK